MDNFRINIWDAGAIVYDNQIGLTTPVIMPPLWAAAVLSSTAKGPQSPRAARVLAGAPMQRLRYIEVQTIAPGWCQTDPQSAIRPLRVTKFEILRRQKNLSVR